MSLPPAFPSSSVWVNGVIAIVVINGVDVPRVALTVLSRRFRPPRRACPETEQALEHGTCRRGQWRLSSLTSDLRMDPLPFFSGHSYVLVSQSPIGDVRRSLRPAWLTA